MKRFISPKKFGVGSIQSISVVISAIVFIKEIPLGQKGRLKIASHWERNSNNTESYRYL